ncbi:MAG: hypothetical protein ACXVGN_13540 [Mycobacteriaceae bacterium]
MRVFAEPVKAAEARGLVTGVRGTLGGIFSGREAGRALSRELG